MTLQQRYMRYFKAHNFQQIVSRTKKYIVLYRHDAEQKRDFYIFLGGNGAVRRGSTSSPSASFAFGEIYKIRLEIWERKQERLQ